MKIFDMEVKGSFYQELHSSREGAQHLARVCEWRHGPGGHRKNREKNVVLVLQVLLACHQRLAILAQGLL